MSDERDLAERVSGVLDVDAAEFRARAEAEAEIVKQELRAGAFDNHQSIVGFEYEFYAVADGRWREDRSEECRLARIPRRLLELTGFEKELGLHNVEMNTSPQPLSNHGLAAQAAEVRARLSAAQDCASAEGMRPVSDGIWTIPPAGETARSYLTDSVTIEGVRVSTNMSDAVRYHAMANGDRGGFTLEAPGVRLEAATVMPESLITSIQPHYQFGYAADMPLRFRYALRIAAPLLALGVNSPLFPPELYGPDWDAERVLAEGWQENRIPVFETVLNSAAGTEKVRFPRDLDDVEEAVDRIAGDETFVPMPAADGGGGPGPGGGDRFDDRFATFRTKHGTYWRWIRPVFEGASRSSANARIEFRPIPSQPTVRDSLAFQAAFAGLLEALPRHEHPLYDLDWATARENFYAAVRDGIDADLTWITNAGDRTSDTTRILADLLDHAAEGLRLAGCTESEADGWIAPLRRRAERKTTPADWKRRRVRERLDAGEAFPAAVEGMQRTYIGKQAGSLLEGSFADW